MAIRNIAHAIQSGETSIGVAIGAESMSLKCVVRRLAFLVLIDRPRSPRPTPEVSGAVDKNPESHDCIQVYMIIPSSLQS